MTDPQTVYAPSEAPLKDWLSGLEEPGEANPLSWLDMDLPEPEPAVAAPAVAAPAVAAPAVAAPAVVTRDQNATMRYAVRLRHRSQRPAARVRVTHPLPPGVDLVDSAPPAILEDGRLSWDLGSVPAGQQTSIAVRVRPHSGIEVSPEARADFAVSYSYETLHQARIVRPALAVSAIGPESVCLGKPFDIQVTGSNRGTGPARAVAAYLNETSGLRFTDERSLQAPKQDLAPGQTAHWTLRVVATLAGAQTWSIVLRGDDGSDAETHAITHVNEPRLLVEGSAEALVIDAGRVVCPILIANAGTADLADIVVQDVLPEGADVVAVSDGGHYDAALHTVTWRLASLAAGQKRSLSVTLGVTRSGRIAHQVSTQGDGIPEATTRLEFPAFWPSMAPDDMNGRILGDALAALDAAGERRPDRAKVAVAVERGEQHVVFEVAGNAYAVPIRNVAEISRPPAVTPVPHVPAWVVGVANVRGDVVSLIDPRLLLALPAGKAGPDQRLLVARAAADEIVVGILVDRVRGLRRLAGPYLLAPDAGRLAPFVTGLADIDGRLTAILDLERFLSSDTLRCFEPDGAVAVNP